MQEHAEKQGIKSQQRWLSFSCFELTSGTITTTLPLFTWSWCSFSQKITPRCVHHGGTFERFFAICCQCSLSTRWEIQFQRFCRNNDLACQQLAWLSNDGLDSPFSCSVDEQWKNTFRYQEKMFRRTGHINDQLYEAEFAEPGNEQKEPTIVGFFILQNANLRMLELHYFFFQNFAILTNMGIWKRILIAWM